MGFGVDGSAGEVDSPARVSICILMRVALQSCGSKEKVVFPFWRVVLRGTRYSTITMILHRNTMEAAKSDANVASAVVSASGA